MRRRGWRGSERCPGRSGTVAAEAGRCFLPDNPPETANKFRTRLPTLVLQSVCSDTFPFRPALLSSPLTVFHLSTISVGAYLVWVQGDPQSQFGHAVLLKQLQVWKKRHAESPRHVLRQPAVVGWVAQTARVVFALEEKHLRTSHKHISTPIWHCHNPLTQIMSMLINVSLWLWFEWIMRKKRAFNSLMWWIITLNR